MILKNLFRNSLVFTLGVLVVLSSCQSGGQSNSQTIATDSLKKDSLAQQVKDIVYPLPTPFEMTKMLNNIGAVYVPKALNPADKADKYFSEKSKALNLGIYGADVAYTIAYNKPQDTKMYLKALKTLMDQLGVKIDYRYMLTDEFKEKLNNKDTLVSTITNTFFSTYSFLNKKNNPELSAQMVTGMWVELMFIATHISNDTYDNPSIAKIIYDQKDSYTKVMNLLASYNSNPDVKEIETKLEVLKPIYDKAANGLTKSEYKLILTTIESIRSSFVS